MNPEKEHKEARVLVRELLEEDKRCRNSDLWLTLMLWQKKQYIKLYIPYEDLHKMMIPETVSRCRRFIQNTENRLLPTDPQILVKRRIKEDVLRKYYAEEPEMVEEWERIKFGIK